jgi:diaminohydroxyphosphoribosylaminopyrimidine deaminase/5-amino-6-(5-phosphoribosylamino)uracil reductase
VVAFYKAWDEWGALSNFSPHPITMPEGPAPGTTSSGSSSGSSSSSSSSAAAEPSAASSSGQAAAARRTWASVEHYYQSQKFAGVGLPEAAALVEQIDGALSPEEAAAIGRRAECSQPHLLRPDWAHAKQGVMLAALRAKFAAHEGPRRMLLATAAIAAGGGSSSELSSRQQHHKQQQQQQQQQHHAQQHARQRDSSSSGGGAVGPAMLVERSPHDTYWGQGYTGTGQNHLGQLLMRVRKELQQQQQQAQQQAQQEQQDLQHHHQRLPVVPLSSLQHHGQQGDQQQQQQQLDAGASLSAS